MTRLIRNVLWLVIASLFLAIRTTPARRQKRRMARVWRDELARATRHSTRSIATTSRNMRVAWVWKSDSLMPNPLNGSETTPIMVNGFSTSAWINAGT